ncbi:MAG: hypothetical protein CMI55_02055 [Parcubacteria group bacterium]|jgi:hypothetical protein|nr:hypothetical protein [Parcubacteria group bacterium]|tara:strand:- start:27 stop:383 length:357 start_codon:yes stop_codon:yes gene_type:complete
MERHNLEGEFRKAVLMAVNTGDYNPMRPQPSFIKLYGDFKERLEGLPPGQERKKRTCYFAWVFIDTLVRSKVEINKESPFFQVFSAPKAKKPDWITKKILVGAVKVDLRYRKMLGKDY